MRRCRLQYGAFGNRVAVLLVVHAVGLQGAAGTVEGCRVTDQIARSRGSSKGGSCAKVSPSEWIVSNTSPLQVPGHLVEMAAADGAGGLDPVVWPPLEYRQAVTGILVPQPDDEPLFSLRTITTDDVLDGLLTLRMK
ncbi:hypothetical protein AAFF_G00351770 [Aldrovandia affinis]|uniref:Uncharacterized protein n=1 Tax=Aldrovandia affinis TaxID=143900 RepID=A0AAD7SJA6_9TELE|nr:hypothetical protein AAFF_G00351770 [Aldrovandia affinis]